MSERFNVGKEVRRALDETPAHALMVLPALAGELLAEGDEVSIDDLKEALAHRVLHQQTNHQVARAVLAMVHSYGLEQRVFR